MAKTNPERQERLSGACPVVEKSLNSGFFLKSIRIGIIYLRRRGHPWGHFFAESRFIAREKTENLGDN